jgi:hypothetical protein
MDLNTSRVMSRVTLMDMHASTVRLATNKINNMGYIKSYGGVKNDPKRLGKLNNKLEFA